MADRSVIINAFKPDAVMDLPAGFAGRRQQVLELVDSLLSVGSCPVIYGDAGLGKSSLAIQIARIALGDVELLSEFDVADRALDEDERFIPFWVPCSDATQNKNDLLQRMINQAIGYSTVHGIDERNVSSVTSKEKISLKFYEIETVKSYENLGINDFYKLDIEDQVSAILETFREQRKFRVLFIIDELDRVSNTGGIASFIKNISGDFVKFLLVGVAQNVTSLLADHASLERQLNPVRIARMNSEELQEIIEKALGLLENGGVAMTFSDTAMLRLVTAANGFPWFVHVLGREVLVSVWDDGRRQVEELDVVAAISALAQNRFAQQFQDLYQTAVKESPQREILLRLMAKWADDNIPLSDVYTMAKRLNVSNPSVYKSNLSSSKNGLIIVSPHHRMGGVVRFRNAMFKQYVNLRKPLYIGLDSDIESVWDRY